MKPQTERLGVAKLDFFFSGIGWLFREQSIHDYGIDAQVEIVEGGYPTGKLIAIQVKSGRSFFNEENESSIVFRIKDKHMNYWGNHTLPVILVLYHPEKDELFWQSISEDTIISTGKNWKILVPKTNTLDENSFGTLCKLTQPESYVRRLNKLKLDKGWMEKVQEGYDVYVQLEDWVNKSLPRYQITISCGDEVQEWPMTYCPGVSISEALENFIPWATFHMDTDAHREASANIWAAECYGWRDKETDTTYYTEDFEDWYDEPEKIVPIDDNGETEYYSLLLSLNEIGESFLVLDSFLNGSNDFEERTFILDDV